MPPSTSVATTPKQKGFFPTYGQNTDIGLSASTAVASGGSSSGETRVVIRIVANGSLRSQRSSVRGSFGSPSLRYRQPDWRYVRSGSRTMMNIRCRRYAGSPSMDGSNWRSVTLTSDARWPSGNSRPA